ncbi:MAG: Adenosylmethionine-8-amino-7-oxononanoate aminotransferase [Alphaproteobacteria bacterium MarineAlpha6_Bin3]|nr:MAG: Adenosylmethionine-8-amino-7-oxononanoate aminotransferase [Alphaproteobacteria bacterium MarineAlpha6_Bin3]|tara:strand:- start:6119 stop:7423 length:1305 start_codon:yes stop_codon:yes gene_type:complete
MKNSKSIKLDQKHIWHPFTQHKISPIPIKIVSGKMTKLKDDKGKTYIDLISSWWVNTHGHCHPYIAKAIYKQSKKLEQVIFGGFTHEPAIELAKRISNILPRDLKKVFFSDNGSTAVEVALKIAYQYWFNQNKKKKTFIAFKNAYHGDTIGAMSLGSGSDLFSVFKDLFFNIKLFDYPSTWEGDTKIEEKESLILKKIENEFKKNNDIAGLIIEPLIQGSGGMNICRNIFMQKLSKIVKKYNNLLIYDEVMTGFGRTGEIFACKKIKTKPDIICLSKGLTGGFLPLSLTITTKKIYNNFLGNNFDKALAHGHSFTANPLGCAASIASLDLFKSKKIFKKIKDIEKKNKIFSKKISKLDSIEKIRTCGTVLAFNVKGFGDGYKAKIPEKIKNFFLNKGLLLRPLGNVLYIMPPYCILNRELNYAYKIIYEGLKKI